MFLFSAALQVVRVRTPPHARFRVGLYNLAGQSYQENLSFTTIQPPRANDVWDFGLCGSPPAEHRGTCHASVPA